MNTKSIMMVALLITTNCYSQKDLSLIPDVIALSKQSAVPIICRESSWPIDSFSMGTAVIIGQQIPQLTRIVALTCEHVVAVKDSANRTIRYLDQIFLLMNHLDGSSQPMRQQIIHADEKNDFVILAMVRDSLHDSLITSLRFTVISPDFWKESKECKEGENIIYTGYPMSMGVGRKNYPLSRTGIISQLVPGQNSFLIDGFIQHGHSGSPVFLIRREGTSRDTIVFARYLIGITRGYPKEYGDIVEYTQYRKNPAKATILNPGFSVVTSMDCIIPILIKKLGYTR